jgi:hypothetical protein
VTRAARARSLACRLFLGVAHGAIMAHFTCPPKGEFGEYELDDKLALGANWRMTTDVVSAGFDVGLWGGQGLTLRSNNPTVVKNISLDEQPTSTSTVRVFRVKGSAAGTTTLEACPRRSKQPEARRRNAAAELGTTRRTDQNR